MRNFFVLIVAVIFCISSSAQSVLYVTQDGNGDFSGNSWGNASNDLQAMINKAQANDEIWVASGIYFPSVRIASQNSIGNATTDKDMAFVLPANVKIYGGFAGYETLLSERDWLRNHTILSGDIGIVGSSTDNCYHVVLAVGNLGTSVLDGFIIRDGNASGSGGNVVISSITIETARGGGIYIASTNKTTRSVIINNTIVQNNSARDRGAGICVKSAGPMLSNLSVFNNTSSTGNGAGICNTSSNTILTNVLVANNKTGTVSGGGIYNETSSLPILTNVTVTNNTCSNTLGGGGMYSQAGSKPTIRNSIFYGNKVPLNININIINISGETPTYSNTLLEAATIGNGIILNSNPKFNDTAFDFRLSACSPAINVGDNTFFNTGQTPDLSTITTDLDGNPRIFGTSAIDLGAFEYMQDTMYLTPSAEGILYVNKNAPVNGNGSSWLAPVQEFADALYYAANCAASGVKEIWVASGTYYPLYYASTESTDNRTKSFVLPEGVKIYGGFPGNPGEEAIKTFQNPQANPTILSGDFNNDDIDFSNMNENAYHVVIASGVNNTLLDGFTITRGNADGGASININGFPISASGGGIYVVGSNPNFNNLIITKNKALTGGGVCNITENDAFKWICFGEIDMNNPDFDCIELISGQASPTFTNVEISNNISVSSGGGIVNWSNAGLLPTECTLINCIVKDNVAGPEGGGIMNWDSYCNLYLTNTLIYRNTSNSNGGAICNSGYSNNIVLRNTTIVNNTTGNDGGGISNISVTGTIEIYNSIIWGNYGSNNKNTSGLTDNQFFNSLSEGLTSTGTNSNIAGTINPLFIDTAAGNYQRQKSSTPINKGNNTYISSVNFDLDSFPRILYGNVDLGAYEFAQCPNPDAFGILYVNINAANADGDGSSWNNAMKEFADALLFTQICNNSNVKEIWVAQGEYKPFYNAVEFDTSGNPTTTRDKTFILPKDIKIYGGFLGNSGTENEFNSRNPSSYVTTLSGNIGTHGVDNCYHIVIAAGDLGTTVLDGFTITGGIANGNTAISVNNEIISQNTGAGIISINTSPVYANLTVTLNEALNSGGGAFNYLSNPTISNSSFITNTISGIGDGGGLSNIESSPLVTDCIFKANLANKGGGIYNQTSSPIFNRVQIIGGNSASTAGGGVYNIYGAPIFINTLISANTGNGDGVGMYNGNSATKLINVTIVNNQGAGSSKGFGIYETVGVPDSIINTIIWGNGGKNVFLETNFIPTYINSIVEGEDITTLPTSVNCLNGTPENSPSFENDNILIADYRLKNNSPLIGKGDNFYYDTISFFNQDLNKETRIRNRIIDMGAFENQCSSDPIAAFSTQDTAICIGDSVRLKIHVTNGSGDTLTNPITITYIANNTDTITIDLLQNENEYNLTITPTANSNYKLIRVKDGNGCENPLLDSIVVTVNSIPTANIIADTAVCSGTSIDLADKLQQTAIWRSSDTNIVNIDTNGLATTSNDGIVVVTYYVIENGCKSPNSTTNIQVYSTIPPSIQIGKKK